MHNEFPAPCPACKTSLFGEVNFCPFCRHNFQLKKPATVPQPAPAVKSRAEKKPEKSAQPPLQPASAGGAAEAASQSDAPTAVSVAESAEIDVGQGTSTSETKQDDARPSVLFQATVWVLLLALGLGGYAYLKTPSPRALLCEQHLGAGTQALTAGDAAKAKAFALEAQLSCTDKAQADAVVSLLTTAEKDMASQDKCKRQLQGVRTDITAHRLRTAASGWSQLDDRCANSVEASDLQHQIEQQHSAADAARDAFRAAISDRDIDGVSEALDKVKGLNLEHPDIDALAAELQELKDDASFPVDTASATSTADAVIKILVDAEAALAAQRFDEARAFAKTASQFDPANAQVPELLQRIEEAERRALREGITIR